MADSRDYSIHSRAYAVDRVRQVKPHSKTMTARRGCDRLVIILAVGKYKKWTWHLHAR